MVNFNDVNAKLEFVLNELSDLDKQVDVPRMKEINNATKTLIFNNTKLLSYYQLNKRGDKIAYFENH